MSELVMLLARVLSISKFSTSLLKFLLKISASSSLLLIIFFLLFKTIDSLSKAFSEKFSRIFYCQRQLYGLFSQNNFF